jgi:hypothetical protein
LRNSGLDEVVTVVAERDPREALLARIAIERAAPQAAAQAALRAALRDDAANDGIRVLFDHVIGHAERLEVFGQDAVGKPAVSGRG